MQTWNKRICSNKRLSDSIKKLLADIINNIHRRWSMNFLQAVYPQKTIFETKSGTEPAPFWWPVRRSNRWTTKPRRTSSSTRSTWHHYRHTVAASWTARMSNLHQSSPSESCSSMVRASHQSSEGCGFDPRLGLRNRFSEVRVWRTFIGHLRYLQTPTSTTYIDNIRRGRLGCTRGIVWRCW